MLRSPEPVVAGRSFTSRRAAVLLDQQRVRALVEGPGVRLLCGRFEGVDERVLEARGIEEVSLGDFVPLGRRAGGDRAARACVRLLPGVIGAAESLAEESFERGLLEYPHFTRAAGLAGTRGSRGPAERESRADPRVAPCSGRGNHEAPPPRFVAAPMRRQGPRGLRRD